MMVFWKKKLAVLCVIILAVAMVPQVIAGSYNKQTFHVQRELKKLGYNPGPVDGYWGKRTRNAIKDFQTTKGIPITGNIDPQTLLKLKIEVGTHVTRQRLINKDERGLRVTKKSGQIHQIKEKRVALVIGNSNYRVSPLRNPANDAKVVSATLKNLDFEVISGIDLSAKEIKKQIQKFGEKIRNGGVGLFYFAGHGMQVNRRNYLIPVDAQIESESDVDIESVRADEILAKMDSANNRLNIVILDACRNNPFARSFRSSAGGLATMDSPSGTLIAYATAPGSVASDGTGSNGLYTQALVEKMRIPDIKIEDMFKKVRSAVKAKTSGQQIPWESSSLEGDFYFTSSSVVLAKKMKQTTDKQMKLKAEIERLELLAREAARVNDESAKRQAKLKKKEALAKFKAEQLRQQQLEEERKKLADLKQWRLQQESEMVSKEREEAKRLVALKQAVAEKRKKLESASLAALSPVRTITEMHAIDVKIKEIKVSFRKELVRGIKAITERINKKFVKLVNEQQDEFESPEEFRARIAKGKRDAGREQTQEIMVLERKVEKEYNEAVAPFIENLKKLSGNEFTLIAEYLTLELQKYDAKSNTYPVTIRAKKPIKALW